MDAVERFTALMAGRGPGPDLDVGALAIAAGANETLEPATWLAVLDRLADGVDSLGGLVRRLFVDYGLAGNTGDYYDPRNSLLDQVLGRRLGIPITLAVVCIEVGRRAGVSLEGVGMPGHFLVRQVGTQHCLDPFAGGEILDLEQCEARFRAATRAGPDVAFGPHLLITAPTRAILARLLANLRAAYRRQGRTTDLEWVLRMRLALPGIAAGDLVELAMAMGQLGRWSDGAAFLEFRADEYPHWADTLRTAARALRAHLN